MRARAIAGWTVCGLLTGVVACGSDSSGDDGASAGGAGLPAAGSGGASGAAAGGSGGSSTGGSTAGGGSGGSSGSSAGSGGSSGSGAGSGGSAGAGAPSTGGAAGVEVDPSWTECDGPGQCIAMGLDCCGFGCSQEPLSRFVGIHVSHRQDLLDLLCGPDPDPCPLCGVMFYNEQYVGVCREGRCQAVDVREDELSACETAADCRLRWGGDCCELCSEDWNYPPEALLAVSTTTSYAAQVCAPEADCPPCQNQTYLDGGDVDCVADHCQVVLP